MQHDGRVVEGQLDEPPLDEQVQERKEEDKEDATNVNAIEGEAVAKAKGLTDKEELLVQATIAFTQLREKDPLDRLVGDGVHNVCLTCQSKVC